MTPVKVALRAVLSLTMILNTLPASANPAQQPAVEVIRSIPQTGILRTQVSKNLYRTESYQAQYTVDVPYEDIEEYYETVPYDEQEEYVDYEQYWDWERVCKKVTTYEEQCRNERQCSPKTERRCVEKEICRPGGADFGSINSLIKNIPFLSGVASLLKSEQALARGGNRGGGGGGNDDNGEDERRKQQEEARRQQEEARRQQQEARERAQEEARRQQEEARRQREEARERAQEDARRRQEEAQRERGQEEARRRQEEARERAQEEARRRQEEGRQQQEQARRQQEEARRQQQEGRERAQEEARRRQEEARRQQEEARDRGQEEIRRRQEEARRQQEEARRQQQEGRERAQEEVRRRQEEAQRQERERQERERREREERDRRPPVCRKVQKCEDVTVGQDCSEKRVCDRVPKTERVCKQEQVLKTRPVTKWRTVTKYRQELRTRTVIRHRTETRCCVTRTRDVFVRQVAAKVEVVFPENAKLEGKEREIFRVELVNADTSPEVTITPVAKIYDYEPMITEVEDGKYLIQMKLIPSYRSDELGEQTLGNFALVKVGAGARLAFDDLGAVKKTSTQYSLIISDLETGVVLAKDEFAHAGASKVSRVIKAAQLAVGQKVKLGLRVARQGVVLDVPVDFTMVRDGAVLDEPKYDIKPYMDPNQVGKFSVFGSAETLKIGMRDLTKMIDQVATEYTFRIKIPLAQGEKLLATKTFKRGDLKTDADGRLLMELARDFGIAAEDLKGLTAGKTLLLEGEVTRIGSLFPSGKAVIPKKVKLTVK